MYKYRYYEQTKIWPFGVYAHNMHHINGILFSDKLKIIVNYDKDNLINLLVIIHKSTIVLY